MIVEHHHRVLNEVRVVGNLMGCPNCQRMTDVFPCRWCDFPVKQEKPVTITPEFQPVEERKLLK